MFFFGAKQNEVEDNKYTLKLYKSQFIEDEVIAGTT